MSPTVQLLGTALGGLAMALVLVAVVLVFTVATFAGWRRVPALVVWAATAWTERRDRPCDRTTRPMLLRGAR